MPKIHNLNRDKICNCGRPVHCRDKCNSCYQKFMHPRYALQKSKRQRQYHDDNKDRLNARERELYARDRVLRQKQQKFRRARTKLAVLEAYGNQCKCCYETHPAFLTMDHIDGGGRRHKREIGPALYEWLFRNHFPGGFQILCWSCNAAKHFQVECPHQIDITKEIDNDRTLGAPGLRRDLVSGAVCKI